MDEEREMREVRKRRLDEECENTDGSTGSRTKRILHLADKSREQERSEDNSGVNEGINQDEESNIVFPNNYLNGNKVSDEDPKDNSNEETGKGGQQDSLDTDSEPCRKAKKTAKMRIQSSSGENASESNISDFDDDYAATGTKKKRGHIGKFLGKVPLNQWKEKSVQSALRRYPTGRI